MNHKSCFHSVIITYQLIIKILEDTCCVLKRYFICLQALNREYMVKLEEIGELQAKCLKGISHQKYRMGVISKSLKQ